MGVSLNLIGNMVNQVNGFYQRPLPRDFENAALGSSPWKSERNLYFWDKRGSLPNGIAHDLANTPVTEVDGDVFFGVGATTTVNAAWDGATQFQWIRFNGDTSTWIALEPSLGQQVFDTSSKTWSTYDTSSTGWVENQGVGAGFLPLSGGVMTGSITDVNVSGTLKHTTITTSSGASAVAITGSRHDITTTATGNVLTLVNGATGQRITIVYVAQGASGDTAILIPNILNGYSIIKFNDIGDSVELEYGTGGWSIISVFNAIIT